MSYKKLDIIKLTRGAPTLGGERYFVLLIDDWIRPCHVYFSHFKEEVMHKFKSRKSEVEVHFETFIKCLGSDGEECFSIMIILSLRKLT